MTLTYIDLEDMEFYAYHGCYSEEQQIGNHFVVQLRLGYDAERASRTDDINDAVNYTEAYRIVQQEMSITSHLIEHVAARILASLMAQISPLREAVVTVKKMNPPMPGYMRSVSVTLKSVR